MLSFEQFKQIERVKDCSPFTQPLSVFKYIADVKRRMSIYYGLDISCITLEDVYNEIVKDAK